jgi:2-polyprenyl-3-methyl-5-hydroxy-6-metoxy-1,4-benzoquinol methylase
VDLLPQGAYGEHRRTEVLPFVPRSATSILDVGCGTGGFGVSLRSQLAPSARIVGIEAVADQAQHARARAVYDEVLDGYFPQDLGEGPGRFDLIVFNDVLEHMLDPWSVLRRSRDLLVPGGQVVASIPSIQYAPVVWRLLRGRWDYTDEGTLDRTHVRFFTRRTMVEMFEQAGYDIETCAGVNGVRDVWAGDRSVARRRVKLLVRPLLGDAQFLQFVVVAARA